MSSISVPGGMFANGQTAALYHKGTEPTPAINKGGPSIEPDTLAYVLSKDGAAGVRKNTVEDLCQTDSTKHPPRES